MILYYIRKVGRRFMETYKRASLYCFNFKHFTTAQLLLLFIQFLKIQDKKDKKKCSKVFII